MSRAPVWSDEVYQTGIQKYRTRQIWKMLKAKGVEPLAERDYPILSATVHASPWGAQFYGRTLPGNPDHLYLSLAPVYDSTAAFSAGLVLQGTYARPVHAFLKSCVDSKAPKSSGAQSRHVTTPSSMVGRPRWMRIPGSEMKWPVWKSVSYEVRNRRRCFKTCAIALRRSTVSLTTPGVVTHPQGRDSLSAVPAHLMGEVLLGATLRHRHMPPARLGLAGQEQVAGPLPAGTRSPGVLVSPAPPE